MSIPIESLLERQYSTKYITKVLEAMATRLGEPNTKWKWLGAGSYANVYWLNDKKKALKITRDESDADASIILKKKPDRSLVKVYDVFELPAVGRPLFGIVVEKLSPLSYKEEKSVSNLLNLLWDLGINDIPTMKNIKEFKDRLSNPDPEKHGVDKYIQEYYDKSGVTEEMIDLWETWAQVLDARHIVWKDFKILNVMARGREIVISDIGYSTVPAQKIPELQVEGP